MQSSGLLQEKKHTGFKHRNKAVFVRRKVTYCFFLWSVIFKDLEQKMMCYSDHLITPKVQTTTSQMEKAGLGSLTIIGRTSSLACRVLFTTFYFSAYSTPAPLHIGYYFAACPLADR